MALLKKGSYKYSSDLESIGLTFGEIQNNRYFIGYEHPKSYEKDIYIAFIEANTKLFETIQKQDNQTIEEYYEFLSNNMSVYKDFIHEINLKHNQELQTYIKDKQQIEFSDLII